MKLRKALEGSEEKEISITAMIDVTFLLLIFFLCTLRFRTLEGKLSAHLPRDSGEATQSITELLSLDLEIRVVEPGRPVPPDGLLEGRQLRYRLGPQVFTDPAPLAAELLRRHRLDPTHKLVIDARAGTIVQDVVTAVDLALAAGIDSIGFVSEQ
jgi:biopolymer transport protein ExbD